LDRVDGQCLQANNIRWTFETVFECVRSSETQLRLLRDAAGDEEECIATEEKYDAVLVMFFFLFTHTAWQRHDTHDTHNARSQRNSG
jgi:hypothetical protein